MRLRFTCSKGFLLILAILIYVDGQHIVLWSLFACIIHEAGHWITIHLMGGNIQELRLTVVGAEMKLDPRNSFSYGREVVVALAGPAFNLLAAWICILGEWHLLAGLNLCFGILNLLPIFPLDGGRALTFAFEALDLTATDTVIRGISIVFSGILLGLGFFAWRTWGNITLFFAAIWLIVGMLKS